MRHQLGVRDFDRAAQKVVAEFVKVLSEPHQIVIHAVAGLPSHLSDPLRFPTIVGRVLHIRMTLVRASSFRVLVFGRLGRQDHSTKELGMDAEIVQRIANNLRRTLRFLRGWITAPSVPKTSSEMGRPHDPRRPELRNVPPSGLGGAM